MANPVIETITAETATRIGEITTGNGFQQTLTCIRPRRNDFEDTAPANGVAMPPWRWRHKRCWINSARPDGQTRHRTESDVFSLGACRTQATIGHPQADLSIARAESTRACCARARSGAARAVR